MLVTRKSGVIFLVMRMRILDEDNDISQYYIRNTIEVSDEKRNHESDDDLPLVMWFVNSYFVKDGTKWNPEKPLQIRRT